MEAARDGTSGDRDRSRTARRRIIMPMLGACLLAPLALALSGCDEGKSTVIAQSGPERAAQLAHSWASHVGAPERTLDAAGDMPLGDSGIAYDARSDTLYGRVWINMALIKNTPADQVEPQRRLVAALNDPKIGGMFDHAGGHFVLDENREGYFLVRAFPVARTTPEKLIDDMERMQTVAARWTTKWFFRVAMIMHGKEKAPTSPVTLQD
jgi:hypothetical protein